MKPLNIELENNEDSFHDAIQLLHKEGYNNISIDLSLYEQYKDDPDRTYAESYNNPTVEEGIDCILVPCSIPICSLILLPPLYKA